MVELPLLISTVASLVANAGIKRLAQALTTSNSAMIFGGARYKQKL